MCFYISDDFFDFVFLQRTSTGIKAENSSKMYASFWKDPML